jgi:hypothetical protein
MDQRKRVGANLLRKPRDFILLSPIDDQPAHRKCIAQFPLVDRSFSIVGLSQRYVITTNRAKPARAMNDDFLKKIIVTAVALIGLASWMVLGHVERKEECLNNCATDFSASRR